MEKHKCIKCNKEATVIEHGKYLCSQHGREYVFSRTYKTTDRKAESRRQNNETNLSNYKLLGWLKSVDHKKDGRAKQFFLTKKGKAMLRMFEALINT